MTRKEEYHEYLKTDRWKTLAAEARLRAGGRCQICNSRNRLNVHHRQYPEVFGTENVDFLTVLCNDCHKLFHKKQDIYRKKPKKRAGKVNKKTLDKIIRKQERERRKPVFVLRKA